MLSPKARAFSVEQLIGKTEKNTERFISFYQNGPINFQKSEVTEYDRYVKTIYDDSGTRKIGVELGHADLWESFHRLGTEMIITKSGRRMFPAVRVRLTGLRDDRKYHVYLDFLSLDQHKYRYVYHSSKWMVSGTGDHPVSGQKYVHSECPVGGRYLMNHVISFEKLKLTNNDDPKPSQISLVSMQKFIPRLHVELLTSDLDVEAHFVTSFDQTAFMAVTAYQNQEITRLKIARNPFAKGFRESGKSRSTLEAVMSSLHCYTMCRNSPSETRKRRLSEKEPDLPQKIFRPTPTRFDPSLCFPTPSFHTSVSLYKHGISCTCPICLNVSTYHQQPSNLTCCCSLELLPHTPREITPCDVCPSSCLSSWSYPCVSIPSVGCPPYATKLTEYTHRGDDLKPDVTDDVKKEPESD